MFLFSKILVDLRQEVAKLQPELRICGANIVQITPQEEASLVSLRERWVSLYRANIVQISTYSLVSLRETDHFNVSQVDDDSWIRLCIGSILRMMPVI